MATSCLIHIQWMLFFADVECHARSRGCSLSQRHTWFSQTTAWSSRQDFNFHWQGMVIGFQVAYSLQGIIRQQLCRCRFGDVTKTASPWVNTALSVVYFRRFVLIRSRVPIDRVTESVFMQACRWKNIEPAEDVCPREAHEPKVH